MVGVDGGVGYGALEGVCGTESGSDGLWETESGAIGMVGVDGGVGYRALEGVGGIEAGTVGIVGVIVSVVVLVVCFCSFVVFCNVYEMIGHFHFGFLH